MIGNIIIDELGFPYYKSIEKSRRYYPESLGFKGSPIEFIKACNDCPPDRKESYSELSGIWKPTWCQKYQTERTFVIGAGSLQND